MFGEDNTSNLYGLMESCADHLHWAGGAWQQSRSGENHSEAGGGHAHVGAMVYLGDNWPDAYRGNLFTMNLHGHRMNRDLLEAKGSGVVAKHGKDLLLANDPWFRGLDCQYGPDGGVFVTDWTDTGECHDYDKVEQDNGRIYKITYGDVKPVKVDLAKKSDVELVALAKHRNEWFVRHSRRILQERPKLSPEAMDAIRALRNDADPVVRLRALWLPAPADFNALKDPSEHVRAWAVTQRIVSGLGLEPLVELAASDPSPVVRLALASGLQQLEPEVRIPIAERLVAHEEDANDAFLPLMVWYAVEPIASLDRARAVSLLAKSKIPLVRQYLTRRMASLAK
jgi:hypothetical protein